MNEFKEMIKEAFLGEETPAASPAREAVEVALRRLDRRDRVVRVLSWFMVTFMTLVGIAAAVLFAQEAGTPLGKAHLVYAALFTMAFVGIGAGKLFLLAMQNHLGVLKELKRVELMLLNEERAVNR